VRVTSKTAPGVVGVSCGGGHTFSKVKQPSIRLLSGLGVAGDAHAGRTVKHRSRVAADPTQPNLRQVHLIHAELFDALGARGFKLAAGGLGENITTQGLYLLALPTGTRLHIGAEAVVEITGLRNPCAQLDGFQPGLLSAVLDRDAEGTLFRKAGVMGIVLSGGEVQPGDAIKVELPLEPWVRLERV
jgi:MOSC domain-containing protein YiiM